MSAIIVELVVLLYMNIWCETDRAESVTHFISFSHKSLIKSPVNVSPSFAKTIQICKYTVLCLIFQIFHGHLLLQYRYSELVCVPLI